MYLRLSNLWEQLRSSYWFIPTVLALLAVGFSALTIYLDETYEPTWLWRIGWFHRNQPDGARELLAVVAGSMITVTGVVFSITIVALSLASQQFGPRLLYNFMRDRGNQVVFGVLIATFVYCLLILRTIRAGPVDLFVPHISVLIGFISALLSLGVLIYFIHHAAESIQAMTIIDGVSEDLSSATDRLFPEEIDPKKSAWKKQLTHPEIPGDLEENSLIVRTPAVGYVQSCDLQELTELASENNLVVKILCRPGDFMEPEAAMALVWPLERAEESGISGPAQKAFMLGRKRTQEQDIEFLINELVEIAVRALSPGVNDPFTAMACVDRLGAALSVLCKRDLPPLYHFDDKGTLRLIDRPISFPGLVDASFNQIRQYARTCAAVTIRQLEVIATVTTHTCSESQRHALLRQAGMIERGSHDGLPEENDRKAVHDRYMKIFDILKDRFGMTGE